MRKRMIQAFVAAALIGTVMHFLYQWLPNPVIGLFAPINESVWEHLKLLFWPVVLVGFPLAKMSRDSHKMWSALLGAILAMPLFLLSIYYILYAGFGVDADVVNIVLYYVTMAFGCWLTVRRFEQKDTTPQLGWLLMIAGLYAVTLAVFSISSPELPIFISKV